LILPKHISLCLSVCLSLSLLPRPRIDRIMDRFLHCFLFCVSSTPLLMLTESCCELSKHGPNPRLVVLPVLLDQIEQVHCAKLLGIYLSDMYVAI